MTTMFSFKILEGPEQDKEGRVQWLGEVRLGAFTEQFLAAGALWDAATYEAQWRTAATQLVNGGACSGFITSYHGPETPWQVWWPAWRSECEVYVQNRILVADELAGPFDPARIAEYVGPRQTTTEDGGQISEWQVHIRDVAAFLEAPASDPGTA